MTTLKIVIGGPLDGGHLPRTDSEYCMLTFYSGDDADGALNYVYRQRVGYWSFEPGDAQAAARAGLHGGEPPTAILEGRE